MASRAPSSPNTRAVLKPMLLVLATPVMRATLPSTLPLRSMSRLPCPAAAVRRPATIGTGNAMSPAGAGAPRGRSASATRRRAILPNLPSRRYHGGSFGKACGPGCRCRTGDHDRTRRERGAHLAARDRRRAPARRERQHGAPLDRRRAHRRLPQPRRPPPLPGRRRPRAPAATRRRRGAAHPGRLRRAAPPGSGPARRRCDAGLELTALLVEAPRDVPRARRAAPLRAHRRAPLRRLRARRRRACGSPSPSTAASSTRAAPASTCPTRRLGARGRAARGRAGDASLRVGGRRPRPARLAAPCSAAAARLAAVGADDRARRARRRRRGERRARRATWLRSSSWSTDLARICAQALAIDATYRDLARRDKALRELMEISERGRRDARPRRASPSASRLRLLTVRERGLRDHLPGRPSGVIRLLLDVRREAGVDRSDADRLLDTAKYPSLERLLLDYTPLVDRRLSDPQLSRRTRSRATASGATPAR